MRRQYQILIRVLLRVYINAIERDKTDARIGWPEWFFAILHVAWPTMVDKDLRKNAMIGTEILAPKNANTVPRKVTMIAPQHDTGRNTAPRHEPANQPKETHRMKLTQFILVCAVTLSLPFGANARLLLDGVKDGVSQLQTQWDHIKYDMTDEDAQLRALRELEAKGEDLIARYPDTPELLTWQGIILSTDAKVEGGYYSLETVDAARQLFEQAIAIDSTALKGAANTYLGALYYQELPWPFSFGDDEKAQEFLIAGLVLDRDGIDANYFLGDFMRQNDQFKDAKSFFEKALKAPDRPNRPKADAGRRAEIKQAIKEINQELAE